MKLSYKLKLIAVALVLGVAVGHANASQTTNLSTTSVAQKSDNWIQVQNENGIKIYFLEYNLNGNSYLRIKFENVTNKTAHFNWTLINKNSENVISDDISGLDSNSSTETIHSAHAVLLKNGESLNDFSINLNFK
jgi:hypothetical protein